MKKKISLFLLAAILGAADTLTLMAPQSTVDSCPAMASAYVLPPAARLTHLILMILTRSISASCRLALVAPMRRLLVLGSSYQSGPQLQQFRRASRSGLATSGWSGLRIR